MTIVLCKYIDNVVNYNLYNEGFFMNISRIALLSAVFCATSIFASQGPDAAATQPGMVSNVINFVTYPFVCAFNTADWAADWIANKSYLNALIGKITNTSLLQNTRINNPQLIGKSLVAVTAMYLAYQAYLQVNEQNSDNDDEIIFIDEEYVD
jgi:hypothetical protein